jgi:hypothetical protein
MYKWDILHPIIYITWIYHGRLCSSRGRWDTKSDEFKFDPSSIVQAAEEIGEEVTKRKILSISIRGSNWIPDTYNTTLKNNLSETLGERNRLGRRNHTRHLENLHEGIDEFP